MSLMIFAGGELDTADRQAQNPAGGVQIPSTKCILEVLHLQALGKICGGDADARAAEALVAHGRHGDLHTPLGFQHRRGDRVQPGQQRPQRGQHLTPHQRISNLFLLLC